MNQQQAKEFVQELLTNLFEKGQKDKLLNYYTPGVVGHYGDQTVGLNEIRNRITYVKARYRNRKYSVGEVNLLDNKFIVLWTRQLKISYRTVQDHLANIKQKYACSTKQQLRQKLFPASL